MRWLVPPLLTAGITVSVFMFGESNDPYVVPVAQEGSGAKVTVVEGPTEATECGEGALRLSANADESMMVCDDLSDSTCERDAEQLCPAGWQLCTQPQFVERNDGWGFGAGASTVLVGEIHDRADGSAGHFTVGMSSQRARLSRDVTSNCGYGTERVVLGSEAAPESESVGCNERHVKALCCAPTSTCGNGVVDSPEEQCDDGNDDETDECLSSCSWREPSAHVSSSC
ncbi:hypothetical protein PPSIR1_36242 [Plesiocystis pacifica SIR-1]|uniref:Uncharacterized protein n=1 Tax=Plesiocystis pacifica SIR-1 TaxID=391625 RepID=A6G1F3_9BACT|nr:DUF4215 domain-containing protein [Plesiocystis pacifica]EDM80217.1 hypothetical protein PPSIR1_36242 [Plesiocystis pacifica SIR-1]